MIHPKLRYVWKLKTCLTTVLWEWFWGLLNALIVVGLGNTILRNIFNCYFLQLKIYYICRCLSMITSDQDYKKDMTNITNNRYSQVTGVYFVQLDSDYIRGKDLDIQRLFVKTDMSDLINVEYPSVQANIVCNQN